MQRCFRPETPPPLAGGARVAGSLVSFRVAAARSLKAWKASSPTVDQMGALRLEVGDEIMVGVRYISGSRSYGLQHDLHETYSPHPNHTRRNGAFIPSA